MSIGFPKVRASEIAGLDVRTRDDYLGLVETALARNHSAQKPDPFNAVSTSFSVPSNDLGFLSVLMKMEMSVVESVSMKGSIVRMIVRNGLSSKSFPPPLLL